jgi:anaerobic selenocysteine-containing dehydrogenase
MRLSADDFRRFAATLGRAEPAAPARAATPPAAPAAPAASIGSRNGELPAYPPSDQWDRWTELDAKAWPERVERTYTLAPTTCFNCESACGLLAYIDVETLRIRKFEGNPAHPGSRGRT